MQTPSKSGPWTGIKKRLVFVFREVGYVYSALVLPCAAIMVFFVILGCVETILDFFLHPHYREHLRESTCLSNEHQIGQALSMYELDYDNVMSPAATWMDALTPHYVPDNHSFRCPSAAEDTHGYGYAFNSNLDGKDVAKMTGFRTTPMVYDSTNTHRNASDPVSSLPSPGRHLGKDNIVYLDGHVKGVAP